MNWITTNIRLPEDVYHALKLEALKNRTSLAKVIRDRVATRKTTPKRNATKIMADLKKLAKENEKYLKGKNLSDLLIEMRYEQ